ncbi:hypothetical protein AKG98_3323 [Moritella sp. JT01]|uniref:hypothetical protein n=1 Tax=Moritella sp. JT01 TaxID=756698 RepID=UPI00079AE6FE|nr:hypothetical protein [Moritella sp. JT01]KXO13107.1 hypothetical protein AKG98_3323 [Moritella sp. JT01]
MSIQHIEEPILLRDFRLATPNATWNQLKANSDVNNALKVTAIKKTGGLCVYCEHKLIAKIDYQIEHFYPKKGNDNSEFGNGIANRAIEWANLYPGCLGGTAKLAHFSVQQDIDCRTGANKRNKNKLTCGQKKGEADPEGVFISPLELNNQNPIFLFNEADGSISLNEDNCVTQNISVELGVNHITRLNLDSERLRGGRLALATSLRSEFNKAFEFDAETVDELMDDWLEIDEEGMYGHPFISLIYSKYSLEV